LNNKNNQGHTMLHITKKTYLLILLTFFIVSCENSKQQSNNLAQDNYEIIKYKPSNEDIQNPGRGFYYPYATKSSHFEPVTLEGLLTLRNNYSVPKGGNYATRHSLFLRQYILDSFVNKKELSDKFLQELNHDFTIAREAGVKFIVRFSYNNTPPTGDCGNWICPPYGDADKETVLAHVKQVSKVLSNNADVVFAWQTGFIGVWGEMMFTDHWGDFDSQGVIHDKDWQDRSDLIKALLDSTPKEMMVQVRKPQLIQKFAYGPTAPITSNPLTSKQAFTGSDVSRLGLYNDCFLATEDDWGTFADYGSSGKAPVNNPQVIATLKKHQAQNSRYTLVGGETCHDADYSPQNDCSNDVVGTIDKYNYTYLNSVYNTLVNNDWEAEGCMAEIKRRLGYRLAMKEGYFSKTVAKGNKLNINILIENSGFTAPMFPMAINIILKNKISGKEIKFTLDNKKYDIRQWAPETPINIHEEITIPKETITGDYELFIHLSDVSNNHIIAQRPEYSIQFANINVWNKDNGYNNLNHIVTIIN